MEVEVRVEVISVSVLRVGTVVEVEPSRSADSESEGGEFHQRYIETATIESHESGVGVFFPAEPKVFRDRFRAVEWFVEGDDFHEAEVFANFCDNECDGDVVGEGDEVLAGFVEEFLAKHCNGDFRRIVSIGVLGLCDQGSVGDAFDVEQQVLEFWCWCGHAWVTQMAGIRQ